MAGGRLILDVSSLVRWVGPPVGIARVQHALAERARTWGGGEVVFVVQHPCGGLLHRLNPRWESVLTGFQGRIDTWSLEAPRRRLPTRHALVMWLERRRLCANGMIERRAAGAAQRAILAPRRHAFPVFGADGARIANLPPDMALGDPVSPGPGDVVLCAGNGWAHHDVARLAEAKARHGFRLVVLCYDLIPLTHPDCFPVEDVRRFAAYWRQVSRIADLVLVTSHAVARDAHRLFAQPPSPAPATELVPLGYDPPGAAATAPLPAGLVADRYALFVSTIEPRKGHAMLLRVWDRLLARGVPRHHGFRLVLVGRAGWDVDAVLARLAAPGSFGGTVLHLPDLGDAALDALYRGAAFCLYPSLTEGFGLPVIEAFARGKATLASSGGALPETVGGLSPCLDPLDEAAWEAALADWIARPEVRAPWEAAIRDGFAHPAWPNAAATILDRAWAGR